jgi:single-stranded DNA-specific DHH superfamily exonuclease
MIEKKRLEELKNKLEESSNPLFLFDNDPDGFCSAVILLKNFGKGKAMPIKSFPDIDKTLLDRIDIFSPDKIFILDKPFIDEKFFNLMEEKGIEVFVIDHHEIKIPKKLESKNFFFSSFPSSEPTSYICQKICNNKNTEWISLIGCIYDVFMPDFVEEFQENYPEMINSKTEISKIRYSSELGKITLILSLALKSSNQTIQNLIELFLESNGPKDIIIENEKNKYIHRRYNQLNKIIERNVQKARVYDKFVFLEYGGEYSLSSDIANFLFFKYPEKFIVVCYKKYDSVNISLRGDGAKKFTEKIVENFENSSGGGHEVACGLRIPYDAFVGFKKMVFDKFVLEKA